MLEKKCRQCLKVFYCEGDCKRTNEACYCDDCLTQGRKGMKGCEIENTKNIWSVS